jgi:hypothetical protein
MSKRIFLTEPRCGPSGSMTWSSRRRAASQCRFGSRQSRGILRRSLANDLTGTLGGLGNLQLCRAKLLTGFR